MFLGLDGVEIGLIIVFLCLFSGIISGFPVAFALGGAGLIAFGILALLDTSGLLVHEFVDQGSDGYRALLAQGVPEIEISKFTYPDLPRAVEHLFPGGWETAMDRNLAFIVNRMNERVFAGQSIETLLAVLMFVMMGITLERSKIANELLTTMARVFGPLPGGLAVSVVVVGAFLAASTGIVGATVVTMGLLSLPTMLKNGYAPELSTGIIAASGTLGQIIPPSIVIVLLGTLAGDLYAAGQETRAIAAGCSDALTYLGKAAVLSVGTLFQAALLPGILLAVLYGLYAFGFALLYPHKAPPVSLEAVGGEIVTRKEALIWFLAAPVTIIAGAILAVQVGLMGSQDLTVDSYTDAGKSASLRTKVSEQCKAGMIALHGQEKWDAAIAQQTDIDAAGGTAKSHRRSAEELTAAEAAAIAGTPPVGTGVGTILIFMTLVLSTARGISPSADPRPLMIGAAGIVAGLMADIILIPPTMSSTMTLAILAVPFALAVYGCRAAALSMAHN
ncbi:MAG: TRAP transporter large permease subunit, partial [Albidovulum sp.]